MSASILHDIRGSAPVFSALGDKTRLDLVARRCLERISSQWDDALARLKFAVEGAEH